jgi:competence protein ComEA
MIGIKLTDSFGNNVQTDFAEFEKQIDSSEKSKSYKNHQSSKHSEISDRESNEWADKNDSKDFEMVNFNPNTATDEDWKDMGLSDKQIAIIDNFESKGGKIRNKEDFKKIYGISDDDYIRISPYILIPAKARTIFVKSDSAIKHYGIKDNTIIIELNDADTISLTQIIGIGPSFAKRICNYRDKLGGFINKEQLKEVYGLNDSIYLKIEYNVSVNPELVKKININMAGYEELKAHPYIKSKCAAWILNYRKMHGNYKDIAEIKNLALVDDELYRKLAPYIRVN